MAELKIATKAFCNTLHAGSFSGDTTQCPTKSEILSAGLSIKSGTYEDNQLVPEDHIQYLWWEYTFSVSPTTAEVPDTGGSRQFTVTSFKVQYSKSTAGDKVEVTRQDVGYTSSNSGSGSWNSGNNTITYGANSSTGGLSGTVTWTQNESSKKATATHSQDTGTISYGEISISLSQPADIPASGGTVSSSTYSYSQTWGWNGATSGGGTITSGLNTSWSSAISADSLGTTVKERTSKGTLTLTVSGNGKSASKSVTVYQQANAVTGYGNITISGGSVSDIPASGGSRSASGCTATQPRYYTSGSSNSVSASISYSSVSASSLGTTEKSRTKIGTSVATATGNGKTATKNFDVYQQANTKSAGSISYGTATVTCKASATTIVSGGGSVTLSGTATRSRTQNWNYTSGATSTSSLSDETATPDWSFVTQGAFSLSGNTVSVGKNTGEARSCTVRGSKWGVNSSNVTITQDKGIVYDYNYYFSGQTSSLSFTSDGGTKSISVSNSYKIQTANGVETGGHIPVDWSIDRVSGTGFSYSGKSVTASANSSTSSRSGTAYLIQDESSKTLNVPLKQDASVIDYIFRYNGGTITFPREGGSSTVSNVESYRTLNGNFLENVGWFVKSSDNTYFQVSGNTISTLNPNDSPLTRYGNITIEQDYSRYTDTVPVSQEGKPMNYIRPNVIDNRWPSYMDISASASSPVASILTVTLTLYFQTGGQTNVSIVIHKGSTDGGMVRITEGYVANISVSDISPDSDNSYIYAGTHQDIIT